MTVWTRIKKADNLQLEGFGLSALIYVGELLGYNFKLEHTLDVFVAFY